MAAFCPNRHRKKRVHKGGGSLLCPGRLIVALSIGITLPVKSSRNFDYPDTTLRKYTMKYGVRVTPAQIVAAWHRTQDIKCDTCAYSLNNLRRGLGSRRTLTRG